MSHDLPDDVFLSDLLASRIARVTVDRVHKRYRTHRERERERERDRQTERQRKTIEARVVFFFFFFFLYRFRKIFFFSVPVSKAENEGRKRWKSDDDQKFGKDAQAHYLVEGLSLTVYWILVF